MYVLRAKRQEQVPFKKLAKTHRSCPGFLSATQEISIFHISNDENHLETSSWHKIMQGIIFLSSSIIDYVSHIFYSPANHEYGLVG